MIRWILAIGLASLLAACASSPNQTAAATSASATKTTQVASNSEPAKDSDTICTSGMEIGSHIPQKTCITRKQAEERKKAAQQAVQNMTAGPSESSCAPSC